MTKESEWDRGSSALVIALLIVVGIILVTEIGRGVDARYVYGFGIFALAAIIGALALWLFSDWYREDDDEYEPLFFDGSRIGSDWRVRLGAMLVLTVLFTGGLVGTQRAFIPTINPYNAGELIDPGAQLFSSEGTFITGLRTGSYPGFIEELLGMVFVLALTWAQLKVIWRRVDEEAASNPLWIGLAMVLSCLAWAFVFASAHQQVYGLDQEAYAAAFAFGFTGQLTNQIVGAPVSILAHFTHNFVVVVGFSIALSIGGAFAFVRGDFMIKAKRSIVRGRQGSTVLWGSLALAVIALVVVAAYFLGVPSWAGGAALSAVAPACLDWTPVPGVPACASDAACLESLTGGVPMDPGAELRCEDGACEARFTICETEVAS